MPTDLASRDAEPCANCGAPVADAYCASCGQRVPRHGSLRATLELQARRIGHSLFALLFRPGLLTVEFCEGRRARSIAPWRLLFNAVTVFFLLAVLTDFRIATIASQDTSGTIAGAIAAAAARKGVDVAVIAERLDRRFNVVYTLLLALTVASYTLMAAATHWRRPWSRHAIFAMHLVAWIFAVTVPYLVALRLIGIGPVVWNAEGPTSVAGAALMLAVFAWMVAWVTLAFRRVYGDSTLAAAAKAIAISLAGVVVDNLVITLAFAVALRSL